MAEEEELKALITGIDEIVLRAEYTADGKFITANKKHIETFGYELEEMKGKDILEFIPKEEREEFEKIYEEVWKKGNKYQITVKRKHSQTGEEIWLINQYVPIKDKYGKIQKVLYEKKEPKRS